MICASHPLSRTWPSTGWNSTRWPALPAPIMPSRSFTMCTAAAEAVHCVLLSGVESVGPVAGRQIPSGRRRVGAIASPGLWCRAQTQKANEKDVGSDRTKSCTIGECIQSAHLTRWKSATCGHCQRTPKYPNLLDTQRHANSLQHRARSNMIEVVLLTTDVIATGTTKHG
jgi:hypothetical protein